MSNTPKSLNIKMVSDIEKDKLWKHWIIQSWCPKIRAREEVANILSRFKREWWLIVESSDFTVAQIQSLEALSNLTQTFICIRISWVKMRFTIDLSKSVIVPDRLSMRVNGNLMLQEYNWLLWEKCTWYIHLPNWILEVLVRQIDGKEWSYEFKLVKYHPECYVAKRERIRIELNNVVEIERVIKSSWNIDNIYQVVDKGSWMKFIVKDVSFDWMCICIPMETLKREEVKRKYKFCIPFISWINVVFIVKNIGPDLWDYFEVWWIFEYWANDENSWEIKKFIWQKDAEIAKRIRESKS